MTTPTVTAIANAKWNNSGHTSLDCNVTFNTGGPYGYTAINESGDAIVQAVWDAAVAAGVAAYVAPTPPAPSPAQQMAAAFATGLQITSSSDVEGGQQISGTYPIDPTMQLKLISLLGYYGQNGTFPNGGQTQALFDINGNAKTINNFTNFKNIATQIAIYADAVEIWGNSNGTIGAMPESNQVTIS